MPVHRPVMLREVIQALALEPGLTVVDGTIGAGGHATKILEQIGPDGRLIGLDRDPMMLGLAAQSISGPNCELRHASYADLPGILEDLGIEHVDRVLLDLGLSSDQLADRERGFSFDSTGPLDLRFDTSHGAAAWQLLEQLTEEQLEDVFRRYGEERFSGPIARRIVARRDERPVRTSADLADAVIEAVPPKFRREAKKHSATRVFQALRIAVNDELNHLERALDEALLASLAPGGRLVVITFHSLEDRIVKNAFRDGDRWHNLTPKPLTATPAEVRINPRSRTAKVRAAERK